MNKKSCKIICPGFLCLILFSMIFLSCTSVKKTEAEGKAETLFRPVYITNSKKVNLLMPSHAAAVFEGLQLLNGSFGTSSFTLLSYTQIDSSGISLSLMNDFGTDMGNVFFDGQQVIFDSAYFPKALPGEYIICDIQNAYYDEGAVRKNLESAGLKFEVSREAGSQAADFAGGAELAGVTDSADLIEIRKIKKGIFK